MRISLTFLFTILLISCSDNKTKKIGESPIYDTTLYLTDRTISENNVSSSGQLLSKKQTSYFYGYDALNGERIIDSIVSYWYYEYDKSNNLVRELEYDKPKDKISKPYNEIIRTYNNKNLQTEHEYQNGILMRYRVHLFDTKNKEIKCTIFHRIPPNETDVDDIISKDRWAFDTIVRVNKYNLSEQLIQHEIYTGANKLKTRTEYSYSTNKLSKLVEKEKNGDTLSVTIFSESENLNLRVIDFFEHNFIDSIWSENERIYKMVNYQKDKKELIQTIYNYDKFGHETQSITKKNYR